MQQEATTLAELTRAVRRSRRWARALLFLLVPAGLLVVPSIGASVIRLRLHLRAAASEFVSVNEMTASEAVTLLGVGVAGLAMLPTALVWLVWLYLSYGNLRRVGARAARFHPGWALGWWFIPIVNLVMPYQVAKELWVRSENPDLPGDADDFPAPAWVLAWWVSWIASNVLERLGPDRALSFHNSTMELLRVVAEIASDLLHLVAAGLAFVMVRTIRNLQDRWLDETTPGLAGLVAGER